MTSHAHGGVAPASRATSGRTPEAPRRIWTFVVDVLNTMMRDDLTDRIEQIEDHRRARHEVFGPQQFR